MRDSGAARPLFLCLTQRLTALQCEKTRQRRVLRGEPVPPAVYIDHVFINAENIAEYYPE